MRILLNLADNGSSPRVRGTLGQLFLNIFRRRFIPACAGNTEMPAPDMPDAAVHPRVCGEHGMARLLPLFGRGSSPRVRGTHRRARLCNRPMRFIPACAGNTIVWWAFIDVLSVHPRVCGEHALLQQRRLTLIGSSPRVRGTLAGATQNDSTRRFIPACAGNTLHAVNQHVAGTVHPRVCGEHTIRLSMIGRKVGSSPRVRGTRFQTQLVVKVKRFIPACAGNTEDATSESTCDSVHPRVCGEHRGN